MRNKSYAVFVLVMISNVWLWRIFFENTLIFFAVILVSILLFLKIEGKIKSYALPFMALFFLISFQWWTSDKLSLTALSNDQIRLRDMRLSEYPPVYVKIGGKTLWIPVGNWFEARHETIAANRVLDNFFQSIDINYYFFANHPRERVGVTEHEKYPYILLPFFIIGVANFIERKRKDVVPFLLIPLSFTSIIGLKNDLDIFSLYPFIGLSIYSGLIVSLAWLAKVERGKRIRVVGFALFFIFLVFLQSVFYEIA